LVIFSIFFIWILNLPSTSGTSWFSQFLSLLQSLIFSLLERTGKIFRSIDDLEGIFKIKGEISTKDIVLGSWGIYRFEARVCALVYLTLLNDPTDKSIKRKKEWMSIDALAAMVNHWVWLLDDLRLTLPEFMITRAISDLSSASVRALVVNQQKVMISSLPFEKGFENPEKMDVDWIWFVIEKNDEKKIGFILHFTNQPRGWIEIGYALLPEEMGKGYGTEAVRILVDYLFLSKDIMRVQATTDVRNRPSQKVLEKVGFKKEGIIRKSDFIRGEWADDALYSILREEWKEPKILTRLR
jgi:RimJ/RimL family protein N-acetyltransferase